ncbi:MAG TPA: GAF domain-containing protein [Thermoanaerobaculia bacterium]|nr:GAF domain-containing protein [Thermoanaerobaculia bacterium]HUM30268.1 GAF domain-containing protein [Thermoanaerobaculia bacterium]HXK68436.1 GAF domain-containing protein [Thermoanaerobaculia bacterium]
MTWTLTDGELGTMTKDVAYEYAWKAFNEMIHDPKEKLDEIAIMSTLCSLLHTLHSHMFWVGFYRVTQPGLLVIGPYQGTPGCLTIAFTRGVCGQAAREKRIIVVPDTRLHPDHIACDARSRSEIVLPVFNPKGDLIAVLDVDSTEPDAFDETDRKWLSKLLGAIQHHL